MRLRTVTAAIIAVCICCVCVRSALAAELYVKLGVEEAAPSGWRGFCDFRPWECDVPRGRPYVIVLTDATWTRLHEVNEFVNRRVKYTSDFERFGVPDKWEYPDERGGDCEDLALLKRRMLIEGGWAREALSIAIVQDPKSVSAHAVLVVATTRGHFVLNNAGNIILRWDETWNYRWVSMMSPRDPNKWHRVVNQPRPLPIVALR